MRIVLGVLVCIGFIASTACKEDKDKSQVLNVPDLKPPVEEALPAALLEGRDDSSSESTGLLLDALTECSTDSTTDECGDYDDTTDQLQCSIKQRFFCGGPSDVLTLLDAVDSRMAEIEVRSEIEDDQSIPCLEGEAMEATSELEFPGEKTFEHYLQCQDSSIFLGFGKKDETWYVREGTGEGAAGHVFSITEEEVVNGYIFMPTKDGSYENTTGLMLVRADRENKVVEFTGGGVGFGFCSWHYRSDADNIFVKANMPAAGVSCDTNNDDTTDSDDWVEICLTSELETADDSKCSDLKSGLVLDTHGRDESNNGSDENHEAAADQADDIETIKFEMEEYLVELGKAAGKISSDVPAFSID